MGAPMAGHLLAAGHTVTVFNRTKSRADEVAAGGRARWATPRPRSPPASDVMVTMLGYPRDVREVILGEGGWSRPCARDRCSST